MSGIGDERLDIRTKDSPSTQSVRKLQGFRSSHQKQGMEITHTFLIISFINISLKKIRKWAVSI